MTVELLTGTQALVVPTTSRMPVSVRELDPNGVVTVTVAE